VKLSALLVTSGDKLSDLNAGNENRTQKKGMILLGSCHLCRERSQVTRALSTSMTSLPCGICSHTNSIFFIPPQFF